MKASNWMFTKAIKWIGTFFEDSNGAASSKRATLYVALWMLWQYVKTSVNGGFTGDINPIVTKTLYGVLIIIFIGLGVVTSEMFAAVWKAKFGGDKDEPAK